jgi:hypothetical protein
MNQFKFFHNEQPFMINTKISDEESITIEMEDLISQISFKFHGSAQEIRELTKKYYCELDPVDFYEILILSMQSSDPNNYIKLNYQENIPNLELIIMISILNAKKIIQCQKNILIKMEYIKVDDMIRISRVMRDLFVYKKEINKSCEMNIYTLFTMTLTLVDEIQKLSANQAFQIASLSANTLKHIEYTDTAIQKLSDDINTTIDMNIQQRKKTDQIHEEVKDLSINQIDMMTLIESINQYKQHDLQIKDLFALHKESITSIQKHSNMITSIYKEFQEVSHNVYNAVQQNIIKQHNYFDKMVTLHDKHTESTKAIIKKLSQDQESQAIIIQQLQTQIQKLIS